MNRETLKLKLEKLALTAPGRMHAFPLVIFNLTELMDFIEGDYFESIRYGTELDPD